MKRELTPVQIEELYAFIKRKGVNFYEGKRLYPQAFVLS